MLEAITGNAGTIIVTLVLLAIVGGIVAGIISKRRKGQSASCSCGCDGCAKTDDCAAR
ncbi:MAG: FeoB-associated Cys-rich membrane protein [Oscillospiraceae bacterium]|jgi:hypothetical protein|nr:FeoB-associated Cys-rich membrane protein [Oscillospiraceae bacterium]